MRNVAFGLFLLSLGLSMTWLTVMQISKREVTGETIFDLVGAVVPTLNRPMFWASTMFLALSAVVPLIGAVAFSMKAIGLS